MNKQPAWLEKLFHLYKSGTTHTFLLSNNVNDYVDNSHTPYNYFIQSFATRDIIVRYNRASRLQFPSEQHKSNAKEAVRQALNLDQGTVNPYASKMPSGLAQQKPDIEFQDQSVMGALNTLELLLKAPKPRELGGSEGIDYFKTFVFMDYIEALCPDNTNSPEDRTALIKILEMARDPAINVSNGIIILTTKNLSGVHPELLSCPPNIEHLEVALPGLEERKTFISYLRKSEDFKHLKLAPGFDVTAFSNLTSGLTKFNIEDTHLRADYAEKPISPALVMERKQEIILQEYGEAIDVPPLTFGYDDLGGNEHLKDYFKRLVIPMLRNGDNRACPMGILTVGPPGTGKSVFMRATAYEAGVNFMQVNPGKLKRKYVGESESLLERVITCILANAPSIVFIDEVDQAIQQDRSSGDSGVSSNQFQRLLQVMADTTLRGKVLWVFATNRPDLLDSAFRREGRMDRIIGFFPPETDEERAQVIKSVIDRYKYRHQLGEHFLEIGTVCAGRTQAQLEHLCQKAFEIAYMNAEEELDPELKLEHFQEALKVLRPSMSSIQEMIDLSLEYMNDASLMQPSYRARFQALQESEAPREAVIPEGRRKRREL